MMTGFGWFSGFGMIFMWLFWIGVIAMCVWMVTMLFPTTNTQSAQRDEPTALEILQRRYARGEVTAEEYAEMRRDFEGKWPEIDSRGAK